VKKPNIDYSDMIDDEEDPELYDAILASLTLP